MLKSPNILLPKNQINQKLFKSQEIYTHKEIPKIYFNNNIINNKMPLALYNSYLSSSDIEAKCNSVKYQININDKNSTNNLFPCSYHPVYINKKLVSNPKINNNSYSELCTTSSFSSIKSSNSFASKNISQLNQNKSINLILTPKNNNNYDSPKKAMSTKDFQFDSDNNLLCFEKKYSADLNNSRIILNNSQLYSNEILSKCEKNNYRYDLNIFNKKVFRNNYLNSNLIEQNNKINDEKNTFLNFKKNSFRYYEKLKSENNLELKERKKSKNYYNKFNSSKENSLNENTVILTLKIKVGKNDYRFFNLKKYDDLFVSLEKFVNINQINQELVKPLVTKIFKTLNRIFWLLNNKIGIYDQEYLGSLYRLWIKNNKSIPKSEINNINNKNANDSSDSLTEKSSENIKSNSFQNTGDNNEEKGPKKTAKTI